VTIPHKENLFRLASEQRRVPGNGAVGAAPHEWIIDPSAAACGAANTLVIERDSRGNAPVRAVVMNTDGAAAVQCLGARLGDLSARRVGIVGAGGSARAIAAALMMSDATVVVYNRTRERAEALVEDLRKRVPEQHFGPGKVVAAELAAIPKSCCDAFINCTPVGMSGGPDADGLAIPVTELSGCSAETVVLDTVYNPVMTPLLRHADAAGLGTIDGLAMFIRQAGAQFEAWTGQEPPMGLFELIAREALSRPVVV
jgi:shikimate dehydrogenase